MSNEKDGNGRFEEQRDRPEPQGTPCCAGAAEATDFWGGSGEGMSRACSSCGAMLKRHRVAVYTMLVGFGLTALILQAGWILGVIAFFRTF